MSHGPSSPNGTSNPYNFGAFDFHSFETMADDHDMMSLLDSSMFANFDTPMNLDDPTGDDGTLNFNQLPNQNHNQNHNHNHMGNQITDSSLTSPAATSQVNHATPYLGTGDETMVGVPGAGPSPVGVGSGFNTQNNPNGGTGGSNTLTEFTKRRNWPARVVEELRDFLQILDANGRIRFVSPSILGLTGYNVEEITDKFLKDFIHQDDVGVFVAELNESIASGNPLRMFYRFRKKDGAFAIFETVGHAHIAAAKFAPNPHNQSPFCQAVFMMARPYPTKNAGLLDSFLEHKIENERLRRRIAELRREEDADHEESQRQWVQSQSGRSDVTPSETTAMTPSTGVGVSGYPAHTYPSSEQSTSMPPPPDRERDRNAALTREALEGITKGKPDSLKDKMARYEGSHTDTIEMLTGLRYIEGERSKGITTGNASPSLIKGDAGIAIPVDRDPRTGEKKKKLKVTEEYVCTDCGTLDSPEWRKGPSGPKTLCNACGLRWAKKEKKMKHNSIPPGGMQVDQAAGMG